ncbi:MAG: hypothetical protein ABW065_06750 [Solirubrobacterales bacterium]
MTVAMLPRDKESWNDDRLDDLKDTVDEGFKDMREEFRAMRTEMAADRRSLIQVGGAIWITSLVGFIGVIAAIATSV